MRPARRPWLGAGLLALTVGCSHAQKRSDDCATCVVPPQAAPGVSMVRVPASPAPAAPSMGYNVVPAPPANRMAPAAPSVGGLRTPEVPRTLPIITNGSLTPAPAAMPTPAPVPIEESVAPVHTQPVVAPNVAVPAMPTRGADPTANTPFYHSPDYAILVGELHYDSRQAQWRLRYAGVDEEDRYGGSVTLDGVGRQMQGYESGQRVRVEGVLVDPESRGRSPAYRVRDLQPVEPER